MSTQPATTDPGEDLRTRWLPSPEQIAAGVAALAQVPASVRSRCLAAVPLAQPGKTYGIWETGQQVVHLPGVWVGENTSEPSERPYSRARDLAQQAASEWMREHGHTGTIATATIYPDGHAAVFEWFLDDAEDA